MRILNEEHTNLVEVLYTSFILRSGLDCIKCIYSSLNLSVRSFSKRLCVSFAVRLEQGSEE